MNFEGRDPRPKAPRRRRQELEAERPALVAQRRAPRLPRGRSYDLDLLAGKVGNAELQRLLARAVAAVEINTTMPTPLIPQPTEVSCWAASMAMVVSYRAGRRLSPRRIARRARMTLTDGYSWSDIRKAVSTWGLRTIAPATWMPEPWNDMLSRLGPLWIVQVGDPYHAVVLTGMHGDGTVGATEVTLLNPWPPGEGAVEYLTFEDFNNRYGAGAGAEAQIVHA